MKKPKPVITLGDRAFEFVETLEPERDGSSAIKELRPQARYANAKGVGLHRYGHGTFCTFQVAKSKSKGKTGLYALVVDRRAQYIGECDDLGRLVNYGFGAISPSAC